MGWRWLRKRRAWRKLSGFPFFFFFVLLLSPYFFFLLLSFDFLSIGSASGREFECPTGVENCWLCK